MALDLVDFDSLVGTHTLTGVDFDVIPRNEDAGMWDDANSMAFVLDGQVYVAVENPDDGYRSSLRHLIRVPDATVKNAFAPCTVNGVIRVNGQWSVCDIIDFFDVTTEKVVLSVGTDNTDDYYPSCVMQFTPEHMNLNRDVKVTRIAEWTRKR